MANPLSTSMPQIMMLQTILESVPPGDPDRASCYSELATLKMDSFHRTDLDKDLQDAIRAAEQAVVETPRNSSDLAWRLRDLSNMLEEKYDRTSEVEYLDKSIEKAKESEEAGEKNVFDYTATLFELGIKYKKRYQKLGHPEELDKAIESMERARAAAPHGYPHLACLLTNLAAVLARRAEINDCRPDLDKAIQNDERAATILLRNDQQLALTIDSWENQWQSRLKMEQAFDDNDEDNFGVQSAVQGAAAGFSELPTIYHALGDMYEQRFKMTKTFDDLDQAVLSRMKAVNLLPKGRHLLDLMQLSRLFESRYDLSGKIPDLSNAIRAVEQAKEIAPEDFSQKTVLFNNLGKLLCRKFERTQTADDLEKAIRADREAVKVASMDPMELAIAKNNLACTLHVRYQFLGESKDMEEAINHLEQTTGPEFEADPNLPMRLSNLSQLLRSRYERFSDEKDLDIAVAIARKAVEGLSEESKAMAGRLSNLSGLIYLEFKATSSKELPDECINLAERAAELARRQCLINPEIFGNLSQIYLGEYERSQRIDDLNEAIREAKRAVEITRAQFHSPYNWLNDLGSMMQRQYQRTRQTCDLEEAIRTMKEAARVVPENHQLRPAIQNNLGNLLRSRFEQIGDMADLRNALSALQLSVELTPPEHVDLPSRLNNLGILYVRRYELNRDLEDLDKAVSRLRDAVKLTPEHDPQLPVRLVNQANAFRVSPRASDNDQAGSLLDRAAQLETGSPLSRVIAATEAIELLRSRSDWEGANRLAERALELLPLVVNRSLRREDQQHLLSSFSGIASLACSLLLQVGGEAATALERLENGRGVILGFLIDERGDLSTLNSSCPREAARFDRLRTELSNLDLSIAESGYSRPILKRRNAVAQELDECIKAIRAIEHNPGLLFGPKAKELMSIATEGPIVVVNVTVIRSDAIIVSESGVRALELPHLTFERVKEWDQHDMTSPKPRKELGGQNSKYREFLGWLWSNCVKLVLAELDYEPSVADRLPRIWWVGTGIAGFLPFHAAGDHSSRGSLDNTFSRAISSYTPTIKALAYARERASITRASQAEKRTVLVVIMPTTPGLNPLRGVEMEMSDVKMKVDGAFFAQALVHPSTSQVLERLQGCTIAHFACHGLTDYANPSNSHLVLQQNDPDGRSEPKQDMLTVRQISQCDLKYAHIAYLSACSTAENRTDKLLDEVIHLASGFQVAGFGHVIGAMWPSYDSICVEVAKCFYEHLATNEWAKQSNRAIAAAIYDSVLRVRSNSGLEKQPLSWAQYIHMGA